MPPAFARHTRGEGSRVTPVACRLHSAPVLGGCVKRCRVGAHPRCSPRVVGKGNVWREPLAPYRKQHAPPITVLLPRAPLGPRTDNHHRSTQGCIPQCTQPHNGPFSTVVDRTGALRCGFCSASTGSGSHLRCAPWVQGGRAEEGVMFRVVGWWFRIQRFGLRVGGFRVLSFGL